MSNQTTSQQLAHCIAIYNHKTKHLDEKMFFNESIILYEELLSELLYKKILDDNLLDLNTIPLLDIESKLKLCYKHNLMGNSLFNTIQQFVILNKEFTSFHEKKIQEQIFCLIDSFDNDLMDIILSMLNSKKESRDYIKVDQMIDDIGYFGVTKFIFLVSCSVINISLTNK